MQGTTAPTPSLRSIVRGVVENHEELRVQWTELRMKVRELNAYIFEKDVEKCNWSSYQRSLVVAFLGQDVAGRKVTADKVIMTLHGDYRREYTVVEIAIKLIQTKGQ